MAQATAAVQRGGLSKAVAEALGRSSWGPEPKGLACPRPRPIHTTRSGAWPEAPEEPEAACRPLTSSTAAAAAATTTVVAPPTSTTSLAAAAAAGPCGASEDPSLEAGLAELRRLFAAECALGTSAPGFGVSPPMRSGAANGLVHDSLWRQEASRACKASLRVLQERAGPRCLAASTCYGDYRLLMTSPDQSLQLLAGAVEGDEAEEAAAAAAGARSSGASRRASPAAGWHPACCTSPDPSEFFSVV